MIPNRWYPITTSSTVRKAPVPLHRMGLRLVVFRGADGQLRCLRDRCSHRGAALSAGKVKGNEIECPYHGFRFDGAGQCTAMPCEGRDARIPGGLEIDTFPLREDHGLVWLWWGAAPADGNVDSLPPVPWFSELPADTRFASGGELEWPLNYVRAIESNFDLHHGPFVHPNLMGALTRVDPITVQVDGDRIDMRATLAPEPGGKGKPMDFRARFVAPSLSLLNLSENMMLLVADCPIDDTTCWRYARLYNEAFKVPVLGKLIAWLAIKFEWEYVQKRQDLVVVKTMTPKVPTPGSDKLVRADMGTAKYLRLRQHLLTAAAAEYDSFPPHVRAALPPQAGAPRSLPVLPQTG
ncbi:MAG: Rieske 2Fe-2S domain-containing protein [Myxococcota bacterium]